MTLPNKLRPADGFVVPSGPVDNDNCHYGFCTTQRKQRQLLFLFAIEDCTFAPNREWLHHPLNVQYSHLRGMLAPVLAGRPAREKS